MKLTWYWHEQNNVILLKSQKLRRKRDCPLWSTSNGQQNSHGIITTTRIFLWWFFVLWPTSLCQKWHGDFLLFGDNPHFWLIGRRIKISRKADHLAISPPVEGGNRKMFKAFGQYTHSCPDGSMRGRETTSTPIWSKVPNTLCAYGYKAEKFFLLFSAK